MINQEILQNITEHLGCVCRIQFEKCIEVGTPVLLKEKTTDEDWQDIQGKKGDTIMIFVSWATPKAEGLKGINLTVHDVKIEKIDK